MTLVELMAVVAILAILAGASVVSMSGMREGSRIRAAESQMENARMGAATCIFQARELNQPAPMAFICGDGGLRWPELPGGWGYITLNDDDYGSEISNRTFFFSAEGDDVRVDCNENECTRVE